MKNLSLAKKTIIASLLLTALNFITFGPTLKYGFIDWDDSDYVVLNKTVKEFDVKAMFTRLDQELYKPVTLFSFAVEYKFFKGNAFVYRLNNLILHSANAILLLCLIYLLTKSGFIAFLCALVFSVHPLHVESVVWIAERKDVLYLFFMLLAFILYLRYKKQKSKKFYKSAAYWLSNLMLVLSLGVKPMAVTLPVMLMLTDWFKGQKLTFKNQRDKLPYFIIAGLFTAAPLLIFTKDTNLSYLAGFGKLNRLIAPFYGIWFYVYKTFLPFNLSHYYTYPQTLAPALTGAGLGLVLLGLAAWASYKYRNSKRFIGFGAGLFLFSILPVSGLVSFHRFIAADRYTYFAQTGIVLIAAYLLFPLWKKYKNSAKTAVYFAAVIMFLGLLMALESFDRSGVWQNKFLLTTDALAKGNADPDIYSDKAWALFQAGHETLAFAEITKAIALFPKHPDHYFERGKMYYMLGYYDLAEQDLREVFKRTTKGTGAFVLLANLFIQQNRCSDAVELLSGLIISEKKDPRPQYLAAQAYSCLEQNRQMVESLNKSLHIDNNFLPAYIMLLKHYKSTGDTKNIAKYQAILDSFSAEAGGVSLEDAEITMW